MKPNNDSSPPVFGNTATVLSSNQNKEKGVSWDEEDESISCDSLFENKKPFFDAKKKLRLVLSTSDFQVSPFKKYTESVFKMVLKYYAE